MSTIYRQCGKATKKPNLSSLFISPPIQTDYELPAPIQRRARKLHAIIGGVFIY